MRNVTRRARGKRMTIEALWADCLDVRELQRRRMFDENWITYSNRFRWRKIVGLTVARYLVRLELYGHRVPQNVRVSWTRPHLGGERPWFHCPHCDKRVAKLYNGLGGYFCRACLGNPPYASQTKSAQGRAHYQACKLRLLLNGEAHLSAPFPERPHRMHRHKYEQLARRLQRLEDGLSERLKKKVADYPSLVAYFS
jgi:hypothetical protein